MDLKPLYATISLNGGLWCVTFAAQTDKDGTGQSGHREGYGPNVFDEYRGSGIPCIDFRTMNFDNYNFPIIAEASLTNSFSRNVPLNDWLQDVAIRGATVTTL